MWSKSELKEYLRTSVSRPGRYSQGETVYGVQTIHIENRASSGKLFNSLERAQAYLSDLPDSALYNPEIHAVVWYSGVVSSEGPSNMRDTVVVDPMEESVLTLTDIELLEVWDVGEEVDYLA